MTADFWVADDAGIVQPGNESAMIATQTSVTFKSSAFNTTEVKEYFINPCCFGDDLAKWLIQSLQRQGLEVDEEPGQEDFGWYVSFRIGIQRYNFIVGYSPDGEEWAGCLERDRGFIASLLGRRSKGITTDAVEAIDTVLAASPVIQDVRWHKEEA